MSLEQGMQVSMATLSDNHPPDIITLTKSVEILTNPELPKTTDEGGGGVGMQEKKQYKHTIWHSKQTAHYLTQLQHATHEIHIMANGSLTSISLILT